MKLPERVQALLQTGYTEKEVAEQLEIDTTEVRALRAQWNQERRAELIQQAQELKNKGYSNTAIAQALKITESSVRSFLKK